MRITRFAPAGVLLGLWSCGLIDRDITRSTFFLPARTYMFDAGSLNLPAGSTTAVPCGDGQAVTDCCNPPAPFPKPTCNDMMSLICQAGVCTAHVTATQIQRMSLAQEVPGLADKPRFGTVSIAAITYEVPINTLNVASPEMVFYLAPDGITDWRDPMAEKFGTLPSIPAGGMDPGMVILEPGAEASFARFAGDLSKAFNFIATTTIDVPSGSPVPTGKIELSVTGKLSVAL